MAATYDVFISHCGEDKIPLALPIYEELKRRGITAFLDMREMPVGDDAATTMLDAVDSSRIGLFILSPEFGAKKWPMLELGRFLDIAEREGKNTSAEQKTFLKLIPVFYRLPVSDCKDGAIFKKNPELLQEHGLMDRLIQGDASVDGIVKKLRAVTKLTGIENKHGATNDDTEEMRARRAELTKHICDEIEGVLFGESEGKRAVSSAASMRRTEGIERSRSRDVFQASWYVPPNAQEVELNFSRTSFSTTGLTPEAKVMSEILVGATNTGADVNVDQSAKTNSTAKANENAEQVVVIKGDAGVGKSCILRGLGRQEEVWETFHGGVYFLSLGMEATEATLIKELLQILRMSGAKSLAESMRTEESLSVVLKSFGEWMRGKRFLLLLDDLWDRKEMGAGVMSGLIGVLEEGSGSALVVTTRFNSIGSRGRMVEVKAREPQSAEARSMLLRYAGYSESEMVESGVEKAVEEILRIGAGLPVCLAIMGRSVAQLVQYCGGDRRVAWKKHYKVVSSNREDVVKTGVDGYADLWTTLSASVEVLEEVDGNEIRRSWKRSYGEMHRGLCVFAKPVVVSLGVVGRLWGMEEGEVWTVVRRFADVGLGNLEVKEGEKDMLRLHDLMHEFAVVCAKSAGEVDVWHRRLLEGYGEVVGVDEDGRDERDGGGRRDGRECREWWKVEGDEYMFRNVSRHLAEGGRVEELERVLMRGEWAMARQRGGGAGLWKEDFCRWAEGIENGNEMKTKDLTEEMEMRKPGLWLIRDAMLESWGYLNENGREFGFQMWSRLVREGNAVVQEFLKSVEKCQERPWVKPLTALWPRPGSKKVRAELSLGAYVTCITWVGGSKYAVGAGREVVVVDVEDIRIVSRSVGHSDDVLSVTGNVESGRLVSCSSDGTVRQWDVESGKELDMVKLKFIRKNKSESYKDYLVTACFSADGSVIVGGLRCGPKLNRVDMWDAESGRITKRSIMEFESGASFVTVSASGRYVAACSRGGQIQMWDNAMNQAMSWLAGKCLSKVRSVAFSPDEKLLVTSHEDDAVRFWDVRSGCQEGEPLDVGLEIQSLALSSDGQQIVVGTWGDVQVWKVGSRKHVNTFRFGRDTRVTGVSFSQNDECVLAGNIDGVLRLLEVGQTRHEDEEPAFGHKYGVNFVCVSPDGSFFVSGSDDYTAIVWDANRHAPRGPALQHGSRVRCGAVSADSRLIATGCYDGTVRIWDATECKQIGATLRWHSALVKSVVFSPDGKMLISGSDDGIVRIWSKLVQVEIGMTVKKPGKLGKLGRSGKLNHYKSGILRVLGRHCKFGKLGKDVEMLGIGMRTVSEGGSHSSEECNEDQERKEVCHDDPVECVAVTPDGRRVICSSNEKMSVWDIGTAKVVCEEIGPGRGVSHILFPAENRVVAISRYHRPMHWHIDEQRGLVEVPEDEVEDLGHILDEEVCKGRYKEIALTRDGKELRWRGDGRTLAIFPVRVRERLWVYDVCSGTVVVGDWYGKVNFYQLVK